MPYKAALGSGVALGSLVDIVPQPAGGGVMVVQRNPSASGVVHEIGLWAELKWSALASPAEYLALLTQFGLHSALTVAVTVYIRNEFFAFARYNATCVRPQMGTDVDWNNYFPREISIVLKSLVAL